LGSRGTFLSRAGVGATHISFFISVNMLHEDLFFLKKYNNILEKYSKFIDEIENKSYESLF
jgi:hypothetical protein